MDDLERIVAAAQSDFAACTDPAALENAKARYLGKGGALTDLLKSLGKLSAAERPAAGARINSKPQRTPPRNDNTTTIVAHPGTVCEVRRIAIVTTPKNMEKADIAKPNVSPARSGHVVKLNRASTAKCSMRRTV